MGDIVFRFFTEESFANIKRLIEEPFFKKLVEEGSLIASSLISDPSLAKGISGPHAPFLSPLVSNMHCLSPLASDLSGLHISQLSQQAREQAERATCTLAELAREPHLCVYMFQCMCMCL